MSLYAKAAVTARPNRYVPAYEVGKIIRVAVQHGRDAFSLGRFVITKVGEAHVLNIPYFVAILKQQMHLKPIEFAPHDRPILGHFPEKKPSHQWAVIRWHPTHERFYLVHGGSYLGTPTSFAELD